MKEQQVFSVGQKALAWSVHIFTSFGMVTGFMAILAINEGDWKMAMIWLLISQVIDGIDGTFARLFRVKEVLPYMDGKTIDYVIDFANYAIIPAYFIYQAGLLEGPWRMGCTTVILLVSALYYGKEGMVSADNNYFVGFPVMWNVVVFFMVFIFSFSPLGNALWILFFAALHFVPIKFVYPSRGYRLRKLTITITLLTILGALAVLYYYPERPMPLIAACIIGLFYYGIRAIFDTWGRKED